MIRPRLALGTAQLGMAYGVANRAGRLTPEERDRILEAAVALGVDYFDTASAYGESEAVIGRYLRAAGRPPGLRIGTKLGRLGPGLGPQALGQAVSAGIDRSRHRLGVNALDDLLVHSAEDLRAYGPALIDLLASHCEAGRIGRIGISVYDPPDGALAAGTAGLRVTQVPFSVFDQRSSDRGIIERLRTAGHTVLARSVLHQGLLTLAPAVGESRVPGAGRWLGRFREIATRHDTAPLAAAVRFAAHRSGADYLVVGVESVAQLEQVAALVRAPADDALCEALARELRDVPGAVRDPRRWPEPERSAT